MKKYFKLISNVLLYLAMAMFLITLFVGGIINDRSESEFLALLIVIPMEIFAAIIGVLLINTKNEIVHRIGHGLTISSFAIGFMCGLMEARDSVSAVLMIVAGSLLILYYVFLLIEYVVNKQEKNLITQAVEWKKLYDDGLITREEYETKRSEMLK